MYEELRQRPNFTRQMFVDNYNVAVENYPFAVFISRSHEMNGLKQEVMDKIQTNKAYGIKTLSLHAIGRDNVNKITALLHDEAISRQFTAEPSTNSEGSIMTVHIFF
jgi:hypothetical protein